MIDYQLIYLATLVYLKLLSYLKKVSNKNI